MKIYEVIAEGKDLTNSKLEQKVNIGLYFSLGSALLATKDDKVLDEFDIFTDDKWKDDDSLYIDWDGKLHRYIWFRNKKDTFVVDIAIYEREARP